MRIREEIIPLMFWVFILFLPWFIMRITFEDYKSEIYLNTDRPSVILAVPLILVGLYLSYVILTVVGEKIYAAFGFLSTSGIGYLLYQSDWREALFPRTPPFRHYFFMWLVILVMLFCFLVPYPKRK